MAAIECKLAMVISRLVKFELLLELKIEQKSGTSRDSPSYKAASSLNSPCANSTVCPSQLYISISPYRTSGNCPAFVVVAALVAVSIVAAVDVELPALLVVEALAPAAVAVVPSLVVLP
jgi:hypothetical protein